jgi:hypothetical protein
MLELTKPVVMSDDDDRTSAVDDDNDADDDADADGSDDGGGSGDARSENKRTSVRVANRKRLAQLSTPTRGDVAPHRDGHLRTEIGFGTKFAPIAKRDKWSAAPVPPPLPQAVDSTPLSRAVDVLAGGVHEFSPSSSSHILTTKEEHGVVNTSELLGNTHHLLLRNRALEWIEDLQHRSATVQSALDVLLRMVDSRHRIGGEADIATASRLGGSLARFGRQLREFGILDQITIPDIVYRAIEMDEVVVLAAGRAPFTALGAMVDAVVADVHAKQMHVVRLQMALNDEASASVQSTSSKFSDTLGGIMPFREAARRVDKISAEIRAETQTQSSSNGSSSVGKAKEHSFALVTVPDPPVY